MLFPVEDEPITLDHEANRSTSASTGVDAFRDPAFMENRVAPVHRWVPWIAGFSGQFVEDVFRAFLSTSSSQHPLVLDPFAGVGTSLVQAVCHGYDTVGFEINPYAALATQVKLRADLIDEQSLEELIQRVECTSQHRNGQRSHEQYRPTGFRSRIPFFSERVEPQILALLDLLNNSTVVI